MTLPKKLEAVTKLDALISTFRDFFLQTAPEQSMSLDEARAFFANPEFDETSPDAKIARKIIMAATGPDSAKAVILDERIPSVPVWFIKERISTLQNSLVSATVETFPKIQAVLVELQSLLQNDITITTRP